MSRLLLDVKNLSKRYCRDPKRAAGYAMRDILGDLCGRTVDPSLRAGEFWALRDVDFQVRAGEVVGLIGHNGAGKSTLVKIIGGVLRPTAGRVAVHTDRAVVMDHQGGLNPVQTGRENVANQLALYGTPSMEIPRAIDDIIAYAELEDFADATVGTYSLGMRLRLSLAIYSQVRPDILIVDEALNGGDIGFQNKFWRFLNEHVDHGGAILMASHELFLIQSMCARCLLIHEGRMHSEGSADEVIYTYTRLASPRDKQFVARSEPAASASGGAVRIEAVDIDVADGTIYPDDPVTVRVRCHSSEAIHPVLCGIEIGGGGVFPLASLIGGYDGPGYSLQSGSNEFTCRVDRLPLAAGTYQVRVTIVTRDSGIVLASTGRDGDAVTLEVHNRLDPESNMAAYRNNLVHIAARWEQSSVSGELAGRP